MASIYIKLGNHGRWHFVVITVIIIVVLLLLIIIQLAGDVLVAIQPTDAFTNYMIKFKMHKLKINSQHLIITKLSINSTQPNVPV